MSDMEGFLGKVIVDANEGAQRLSEQMDGVKLIGQRQINIIQQEQINGDRAYIRSLKEIINSQKSEINSLKQKIAEETGGGALFDFWGNRIVSKTEQQRQAGIQEGYEIANSEFKALLSKPMHEIAQKDSNFKKTYEQQMELLADWMVSQKAFKELAMQFGFDAHGHTPEQVVDMGCDKEIDVLLDKHDSSHNTNVGDGSIIGPRKEVLIEKYHKDKAERIVKSKGILEVGSANPIILDSKSLTDDLKKVAYATGNGDARLWANGIHFSIKDNYLAMTATNGARLAQMRHRFPEKAPENVDFIIPEAVISDIANLLSNSGGVIEIRYAKHTCEIRSQESKLVFQTINANFPNVEKMLAAEVHEVGVLDRYQLLSGLRRLEGNGKYKNLLLRIDDSSFNLVCDETGVVETFGVTGGFNYSKFFNVKYLSDPLGRLGVKNVSIAVNTVNSVVVISTPEDAGFFYMVMPINN